MKRIFLVLLILLIQTGCASQDKFMKTVDYVDINRFMTKWYVIAGRLTFMEKGAHNAVEIYSWNEEEKRIDIDFSFNKDSFSGKVKSIPQKAWIVNNKTNAHWKVSPFWPIKFNYLVIDMDEDYSWVVIGVPGQEWVWIMSTDWQMSDEKLDQIISRISKMKYNTKDIKRVPQQW